MKPKQLRVIKCPTCGYEYLPAEIYLPNDFLGKPYNIIRDSSGKIIGYDGNKMNDVETYLCDNCLSEFEVTSTTNFVSKKIGVDTPYHETKLHTDKLFLSEM